MIHQLHLASSVYINLSLDGSEDLFASGEEDAFTCFSCWTSEEPTSELALPCYFTWAQVDAMLRHCYTISPKPLRIFLL